MLTDLELAQVRPPAVVHQLQAVTFGKIAQIRDEGSDEEHVSTQSALLMPEALHRLGPPHVLRRQTSNLNTHNFMSLTLFKTLTKTRLNIKTH